MAQISKRFLQKQVEERILDLFWTSLASISTKEKTSLFLDALLTPTEKLMLSKRLAIAFMLTKGYDYAVINNLLKVSDSTIWATKLALNHASKEYKATIERIIKKEKWEKLWDDLAFLLDKTIPPRPGTNWKEVRRKQWDSRRKKQKSF